MKREDNIEILEELLNSIKSRGYLNTLKVLKTEKQKKVTISNPYDKFVVQTISDTFGISQDELLFNRYMRGEHKYAVGFCVYYLYEKKSIGEIHKTIFRNKNKSLLSKYRQIIFDLRNNNTMDKRFITMKLELDKKIENFKKENK